MNYRNSEMKLDQIIGYLNEEKINLSPVFQRGHVWKISTRKKLVRNIVQGRPIPAIFLYKEPAGTRYSYNILDGKQRLESIILFVADGRAELGIPSWHRYFFGDNHRQQAHFSIDLPEGEIAFRDLGDIVVRDFREYAIPTIEISLTDDSSLDEIINLFVDINQEGEAVSRFAVVKAMGKKNALLSSVFALIAEKQGRGQDVFYRAKRNEFTSVLKTLKLVAGITDANSKVDRMWERLLEIALFAKTRQHRPPTEVLKGFITTPETQLMTRPTKGDIALLRKVFKFLEGAYRKSTELALSSLAVNQVHFYTVITSLIESDLLSAFDESTLIKKLELFGKIIDKAEPIPRERPLSSPIRKYIEQSQTQTTHVGRRAERQQRFIEALRGLPVPGGVG